MQFALRVFFMRAKLRADDVIVVNLSGLVLPAIVNDALGLMVQAALPAALFGLGGSLVLGFLDLQAGHAQNRFFNGLEEWLSGVTQLVDDLGAPPIAAAHAAGSEVPETVAVDETLIDDHGTPTLALLLDTLRAERGLLEQLIAAQAGQRAAASGGDDRPNGDRPGN